MANGFRGEQSAKAAKKRSKDFDFPEKAFGAGKAPKKKRAAPKGMADRKGKGPARTIAEAKRRGLSTFTDKSGKKKAAVTAEELKKSGLSLRDYLNKQQGKTRKASKTTSGDPRPDKVAAGGKPAKKVMPNQKGITAPKPKAGSTPMIPLGSSGSRVVDEARKKRAAARTATNLGSGRTGTGGKGTPYMGFFKAGGMKKGYKMGGMKKGYSMGGMKKKGYSMGGMKKKGMKKGGKVRGAGIERKGLRKAKYI